MPGFDRTGPWGLGPMTGWGRGRCGPSGMGAGRRAGGTWFGPGGRGRGRRHWYWAAGASRWGQGWFAAPWQPYHGPGYPTQDEMAILRQEAAWLKEELAEVEERLRELESGSGKQEQ
jgi:hypothetical protein